jgi:glutamyl-tRNA reductase
VQLTNKLLHAPTRTLNKDSQAHPDLADAINRIYHLDDQR